MTSPIRRVVPAAWSVLEQDLERLGKDLSSSASPTTRLAAAKRDLRELEKDVVAELKRRLPHRRHRVKTTQVSASPSGVPARAPRPAAGSTSGPADASGRASPSRSPDAPATPSRTTPSSDTAPNVARPAGPASASVPAQPPASPPPEISAHAPAMDLERGDDNTEVEALQLALVQLGQLSKADMDTGPGIFGPKTEAALKAFQTAWSVPSTGYYGPLTRTALTQALGGAKPPEHPSIPGAEQAIQYALSPPANPMDPTGSWHYWCLGLVNLAFKSAGRPIDKLQAPTAIAAYHNYANAGLVQTQGTPPRGALVFFSWQNEGHIGISLGDGTYVGTLTSGAATGVRPINQATYLGWANP